MSQPRELDSFRELIARRLGLGFDESRQDFLRNVLRRRAAATGCPPAVYVHSLDSAAAPQAELRILAAELTVGETYFFRHAEQFRALVSVALPARFAARAGHKSLSILSAGCASGEETYSLAMLVREALPEPGWNVSILGIDMNPAVLEKAREGLYNEWSLRATPDEMRARWFQPEGKLSRVRPEIRAMVRFEEANLTSERSELWREDSYDIVFCRNVLMYATPPQLLAVVRRFGQAIVPGGYLFMGHAENLRGKHHDFTLCNTHDTFYYRRRGLAEGTRETPAEPIASDPAPGWMEAIEAAARRIENLPLEEDVAAPPAAAPLDLHPARELLARGLFGEALAAVEILAAAGSRDPELGLLRAALRVHTGQLEQAEDSARELLASPGVAAEAHHVLALCREATSDPAGAIYHDRRAIQLDGSFGFPHLHLGLAARRSGNPELAVRELRRAEQLFAGERSARILLFGGGFDRAGLLELCRAELARLRGGKR